LERHKLAEQLVVDTEDRRGRMVERSHGAQINVVNLGKGPERLKELCDKTAERSDVRGLRLGDLSEEQADLGGLAGQRGRKRSKGTLGDRRREDGGRGRCGVLVLKHKSLEPEVRRRRGAFGGTLLGSLVVGLANTRRWFFVILTVCIIVLVALAATGVGVGKRWRWRQVCWCWLSRGG
jgi:hypothetical protein